MGTYSCSKLAYTIALIFITCLILVSLPAVQAQSSKNFTSADLFTIPSTNSQINFAVNGSYSSATLQEKVWTFTDLHLNRYPTLRTLKISAENSNVTILYYQTRNSTTTGTTSETLRYWLIGEGKVTINFGMSNAGNYGGSDWYVSKPGRNSTTFLSLGHDYELGNDGTLTINGIKGNVSVTHYFLEHLLANNPNLPFYYPHSVIITTAILVAVTFGIVLVIKLRNNRVDCQLNENGDVP